MTEIRIHTDGHPQARTAGRRIYVGDSVRRADDRPVRGGFVTIGDERFYRISGYDQMEPFFMSIVSHSDHWMFVSSNGALTAGRKNPEHALFPYYTVDKIHDSAGTTGGKTLILADVRGRLCLWEPFAREVNGLYAVERNLYKNVHGSKLLFEEINRDLGLVFQTLWTNSEKFGFVRYSVLVNKDSEAVTCTVLDGIQNLLPSGVDRMSQNERSTLLDAYKKNELLTDSGLGLFLLSSLVVDKPEPSESLSATTAWSVGLGAPRHLLSSAQLDRFRNGESLLAETDIRGRRGAYFVVADLSLTSGESSDWYIVADVDQGPAEVAKLRDLLRDPEALRQSLEQDILRGAEQLAQMVAAADGLQQSSDELSSARHFSNVLFNLMRGGTFADGYRIEFEDLAAFIGEHNRTVRERNSAFLDALDDRMDVKALLAAAAKVNDPDLSRLCREYLPITFSRRHGDPSRPWNYFSIDIRSEEGERVFNYQGNWRDIFQNWEALCMSYPDFTENIIVKFVNASTPDGYNPYRIMRGGIDWELHDPEDPWSFIGYWGDHQIVYLLKLLEISRSHDPVRLVDLLTLDEFVFANVPYRIKPYESLLQDPHDTIVFDDALEKTIQDLVDEVGADGRLLRTKDGGLQRANLTEKLLISVLAKMSNFVPEGGIWMNTQRPEWNDANNALVGYGVSVVTLCYLRRFQTFLRELLGSVEWNEVLLAAELSELLLAVTDTLRNHRGLLDGTISDTNRKRVLDELGSAGGRYRDRIYAHGFTGERVSVLREDLLEFIELSIEWADHTIRANRRGDGLYHSYNLLTVDEGGLSVGHLYKMLEGQVAVLSSGLLAGSESVDVLDALRDSDLYRADQYSFLLYPDRELPRFVDKNVVPKEAVIRSTLLPRLLEDENAQIVVRDVDGVVHFNGSFRNRSSVSEALDRLSSAGYGAEVEAERNDVLELFDRVFDHKSYTGRSGTFFGYEGLGCIYWHMVSKLLLATGETILRAGDSGIDDEILGRLVDHYYSIRAGIGLNKSPDLYGAFPTDPYSHTPAHSGAKQPGMTGQVKEDILARWFELGVHVIDGCLTFRPSLLREEELLAEDASFVYYDVRGGAQRLEVSEGCLVFTYCQVPVVYCRSETQGLTVVMNDGERVGQDECRLDSAMSEEVFGRTGQVRRIEVGVGAAGRG